MNETVKLDQIVDIEKPIAKKRVLIYKEENTTIAPFKTLDYIVADYEETISIDSINTSYPTMNCA